MFHFPSTKNVLFVHVFLVFASISAFGSCTKLGTEPAQHSKDFVEEQCWFQSEKYWPKSICGQMFVSENPLQLNSPRISFPVIRFEARNPDKEKHPVLIAGGGGPGNPLGLGEQDISHWSWKNYFRMSVGSGRDLILIDNRGVGLSLPRLACPEVKEEFISLLGNRVSNKIRLSQTKQAFKQCRHRLLKEGIDPSQYNNVTAAHDIEALRKGLRIKKWNLYGVSYGTRIALSVLRKYPETVHAVLLDSVYPPEIRYLVDSPKDNEASLNKIIKTCEESENCRNILPEFRVKLIKLIGNLKAKPITLSMTDPRNYSPLKVILDDQMLIETIFSAGYVKANIERVPLVVRSLWEGNLDLIGAMVRELIVVGNTIHSLDIGAYASYSCHGENPFNTLLDALGEAKKYPIQKSMNMPWIQEEKSMCEAWDVQPGSIVETLPVVSNVPALLYAGEFDFITPSRWAEEARRHLSHSYIKIWPGIGHHSLSALNCSDRVAQIFFDNPYESPFTDSCIANANNIHLTFQKY